MDLDDYIKTPEDFKWYLMRQAGHLYVYISRGGYRLLVAEFTSDGNVVYAVEVPSGGFTYKMGYINPYGAIRKVEQLDLDDFWGFAAKEGHIDPLHKRNVPFTEVRFEQELEDLLGGEDF